MKKLKVLNTGKKTRSRLGYNFEPKKEKEIEVSNREYMTVKAVRDFEVEILDNTEKESDGTEGSETLNVENDDIDHTVPEEEIEEDTESDSEESINLSDLTVDEAIKAVENGKIGADEAIAQEIQGKNRSTLLDELEGMKTE